MSQLTAEMERNIRTRWVVGDWVEVYSKSRDQWFRAKIIEIYDDDDGEWLAVMVENTMVKEVQRFTPDVRPLISHDDDDSDSGMGSSMSGDSGDSSSEDSDSLSYSHSDEDEKEKMLRKQKKTAKKLSKHHELVMVFVSRTGTNIFNGKYVYSTTSEEGYPMFEHVDNKHLLIKQNEDEMRWEFSNNKKKQVCYYADSDKEFPPSSGWNKTKFGDLPNPGVRLQQLQNEELEKPHFEEDPYKFSPFLIQKYKFKKVNREPLGFDLQVLVLHSQFVAVKSIKPESQAEEFEILPGDILVSANEVDLSAMKGIEDVSSAIEKLIKSLGDNKEITITFAREKKTFKVLMCQRAGTKCVNGKYSIQGMENDALLFANNSNKNLKIMRIYENKEEDEAIWALREINVLPPRKDQRKKPKKRKKSRKNSDESISLSDSTESSEENHRDYYIVLASAKDEIPPECAWEAVDPHGLWPAAGLQYYDVKVVPPSKPRIIRTQPNPNAVQIRFECDEAGRKPKVCPHMECWYEIEMSHYKYNMDKGKTSKKAHDTKIWKTKDTPFVANRLINGDDYEFIVRSCNHIASTNSESSPRVTPLQLPPKPKIIDITGKPGELYIHFHCPNAKDREVQAQFEIIIDPPIDEECQDYPIKEHRLLVDNDNKPVRLRNLINGTKYQIIVASVNSVGVTYSEPESAYPSKEPPLPILSKVTAGNREIIVHFKCDGFDKPDIKSWFEMELDPPPPSIDQAGITYLVADEKKSDEASRGHSREKSRMRTKLARKSRWRRQTISQKLFMGGNSGLSLGGLLGNKHALNIESDEKAASLAEEDHADFIPYFRRATRHYGSPVKISPVVNGIPYIVRVKAVSLSGSKISAFSSAITPKGPPPMPKINKLKPMESCVQIEFVCNDYATQEYKAQFDIESFPQTVTMKGIVSSPNVFPGLNNGRSYKFHLRGVNKEGKSKWSEVSAPVTPLKIPPTPIELRTVPFDGEITVFWVCEELKTPEYSGWYEVESEPATFTMVVTRQQARFRRLDNGRKYTFKVTAVNQVGKARSEVSKACIPDDDISKESYLRKKKYIACEVKEILLKLRKQKKKQIAHDKLGEIEKKKKNQRKKADRANKAKYDKVIAKQKKKLKQQESLKRKEEKLRVEKKKKMEQQRQRVMLNKRRMSVLAREKISKMEKQFGSRNKNMNTASSMMMNKKNKNKNKKVMALLDMKEISKLSKAREKDEKKVKKLNGVKDNKKKGIRFKAEPTKKSKKKRKTKRKKGKKLADSMD